MSIAISVEHVTKAYRLGSIGSGTLGADLSSWWARVCGRPDPLQQIGATPHARQVGNIFWALEDLTFSVNSGEVVGIIGRNGAGKSTLLKILSQVTAPTAGRIKLRGRVASLLEVGTGFHPDLTGRENVFLNGAIMGMTKAEIKSKFDEIVAFSEIENFIDTPVKRYSSGMYVRLAFAVAAHLDPEILIVDEVLAVGDAAFQKKCMGKMNESKGQGRTVLFVSHNMQAVRQMCDTAIYLRGGRTVLEGTAEDVVQFYLQESAATGSLDEVQATIAQLPVSDMFRLLRVNVTQSGRTTTDLVTGEPALVEIEYELYQDAAGFIVWAMLLDTDGIMICESFHNGNGPELPTTRAGRYVATMTLPADFLAGRQYDLQIGASIHNKMPLLPETSPIVVRLSVLPLGNTFRAYPGYTSPGRVAPLLPWSTRAVLDARSAAEPART